MSFKSVQRLMDVRVEESLEAQREKKNVANEGTQYFLGFIRLFLTAFLSPNLDPLTRIHDAWHVIFCLRLWRNWLKENKISFTKFITINAYTAMEINAHTLINLVRQFREENRSLKDISFFSSQMCESFFRTLRSLTGCRSTITEVNVQDALHRMKKVELAEDIECTLTSKASYKFRNRERRDKCVLEFPMPDDQEIVETVLQAKDEAIAFMKKVGINYTDKNEIPLDIDEILMEVPEVLEIPSEIPEIPIHMYQTKMATTTKKSSKKRKRPNETPCPENPQKRFRAFLENLTGESLRDSDSRYLHLETKSGNYLKMRKSTIVWNLMSIYDNKTKARIPRFTTKNQTKTK